MTLTSDLAIKIEGMHCGGCINRVTAALKKLPGVEVTSVEIGSALVHLDPAKVSAEQVIAALDKIGFRAAPVS